MTSHDAQVRAQRQTTQSTGTYRIIAASTSKIGDYIVEDLSGERWLYIGSTGCLSKGSLSDEVLESLMYPQRWVEQRDSPWLTLAEIRAMGQKRRHLPAFPFRRNLAASA